MTNKKPVYRGLNYDQKNDTLVYALGGMGEVGNGIGNRNGREQTNQFFSR